MGTQVNAEKVCNGLRQHDLVDDVDDVLAVMKGIVNSVYGRRPVRDRDI